MGCRRPVGALANRREIGNFRTAPMNWVGWGVRFGLAGAEAVQIYGLS